MAISNAAVAGLSAPASVLKSDGLATFLIHLLPSHQVKVSVPKKGSSLSLNIHEGTNTTATHTLVERNAILRALCGLPLLNILDRYPFCLLGGRAESTGSGAGAHEASMVICSIGSFMSVASLIRSGDSKEKDIVPQLNEVLAGNGNSFLVGGTFKPTLADYDVLYALSEKKLLSQDIVTKDMKHLRRWIVTVIASMEELLAVKNNVSVGKGVPDVSIPSVDFGIADPVPVFFFGEEGDEAPAAAASASASAPAANPKAGGKKGGAPAGGGGGGGGLSEEEKKAAAEKRAKKNAEKAKKKAANAEAAGGKKKDKGGEQAAGAGAADELNVTALDIRVGKIIEVWEHESSDKLWCEKIDLGDDEPRQVLSGLRQFYKKEEMDGRMVLVLKNLKKRNLAGVPSHGMVLCASNADHTAVEFVIPPEGAKIGERVEFDGLSGDPAPENKLAKKKMLEKLAPDLKTNSDGVVVWKGIKSVTSAGPCVASKGMKDAQVS